MTHIKLSFHEKYLRSKEKNPCLGDLLNMNGLQDNVRNIEGSLGLNNGHGRITRHLGIQKIFLGRSMMKNVLKNHIEPFHRTFDI